MIRPEDIQKQQFETGLMGYKTREVDDFLSLVCTDLKELYQEIDSLKRKVAAAELIAKDAKNHEDDFIASMAEDKKKSEATLAAAKAEGERIIREAKNAASGIMTEVRRRAGDISNESRKASVGILEDAQADAEKIRGTAEAEVKAVVDEAKAEAEKKLYSARTEADNTVRAARTEAESLLSDAKTEAEAILADAAARAEAQLKAVARSAAQHDAYIKEVRSAAEKLCFEIDAELKNSASRIALLGRRISSAEIPEISEDIAIEEPAAVSIQMPAPEKPEKPEKKEEPAPAHAVKEEPADEQKTNEDFPFDVSFDTDDEAEDEVGPHGGYFSHEYKLAMEELFGDDVGISSGEDDDTYDYVEHKKRRPADDDDTYDYVPSESNEEDDDDEDDEGDGDGDEGDRSGSGNSVTSEYNGLGGFGGGAGLSDIFTEDALEKVFKTPTAQDINDILNGQ